jgi:hypothetical protein
MLRQASAGKQRSETLSKRKDAGVVERQEFAVSPKRGTARCYSPREEGSANKVEIVASE